MQIEWRYVDQTVFPEILCLKEQNPAYVQLFPFNFLRFEALVGLALGIRPTSASKEYGGLETYGCSRSTPP